MRFGADFAAAQPLNGSRTEPIWNVRVAKVILITLICAFILLKTYCIKAAPV